ncbi:BTAD domain-containing putative transcriptional regulator [Streptosporangium sp. NPDC049376]|uniref:BTAD domain-containing putative transcriptional regulator n=1 Tax=Streptosporangium sp. NPDC049376 TaxID=3366192 RepID=UPI0037B29F65
MTRATTMPARRAPRGRGSALGHAARGLSSREKCERFKVDFRVLGPMEVRADDGTPIRIGGPRLRAVLARLLIAHGSVVSAETLIDDLYGDAASPGAMSTLHSFISHLRRALEPSRGRRGQAKVLIARQPGYLLAAQSVDADRFTELVGMAERHSPMEELAAADEALGMWRGSPYEEFGDQLWAVAEVSRLRESRLVAVERRARALLELGRPQSVITELEGEVITNPLRERLWCLLALALYRTGRQGDALAVLRRARHILADELGVDPGPELRSLEEDILRQADGLNSAVDMAVALTGPQPPDRLYGRGEQLSTLLALPGQAVLTGLAVASVSGERGIGKTRLLEEFAERCASLLGQFVVWGRCQDTGRRDTEGLPPLWLWRQVFEALARHYPPPDRRALAGLLGGECPDDVTEPLARRNQAIARWLVAASQERPLVIILDGLQWADRASLDLLADLVVLVRGGAVTLVAASRSGMDDPLVPLVPYDLTRVRLTGLGPAAVQELAANLGVELSEEAVARMTDRTGGNPFCLRETVKLFDGNPDEVPQSVIELVRTRMNARGEMGHVLAVAGVIGREFDPAVVGEVIGADAYDLLDQAVRSGLLEAGQGRLAFGHDLVREALVQDLPPLRKAAVHRDVAAALAARPGTDVAVIAHHAVQSGPAASGEAARWSVAAADQAELRGAYAEAATWMGHAVVAHDVSGGDPAEHVELLLRQVRALSQAGDPIGARRARAAAVRAADRTGATEQLVRALVAFDVPALWPLRDPYGKVDLSLVRRFESVLGELPRTDGPERALLLAGLAQELCDDGAEARCDSLSAEAVAVARRLEDPALLRRALNARYLSLPGRLQASELTRIADELYRSSAHEPAYELLACMMDAHRLLETFDVVGADVAAARCDALLRRHPFPWPRFQHTLWRASRLTLDGRFDEADVLYADAEEQAGHLGVWHAVPTAHAGRLPLSYHRGTVAAADLVVEATRSAYPALGHDVRGRTGDALTPSVVRPPLGESWLSAVCLRAAAAAALGHPHQCRSLYESLLPYSGRISALPAAGCMGPVDWYLALLASATGQTEEIAGHLDRLRLLAAENGLTWWHDRATRRLTGSSVGSRSSWARTATRRTALR